MGFLKKELQPGLCVSLSECPPLDFPKYGFGNDKICWTTPGQKLDPPPPPPPPPWRKYSAGSTHDYAPVNFIHASHPPPPPQKKKQQKTQKNNNNLRRWLGMVGPRCRPIRVCLSLQCRGFNTGTVISVLLFFLVCTN